MTKRGFSVRRDGELVGQVKTQEQADRLREVIRKNEECPSVTDRAKPWNVRGRLKMSRKAPTEINLTDMIRKMDEEYNARLREENATIARLRHACEYWRGEAERAHTLIDDFQGAMIKLMTPQQALTPPPLPPPRVAPPKTFVTCGECHGDFSIANFLEHRCVTQQSPQVVARPPDKFKIRDNLPRWCASCERPRGDCGECIKFAYRFPDSTDPPPGYNGKERTASASATETAEAE